MKKVKNTKKLRIVGMAINIVVTAGAVLGLYFAGFSWFAFGAWVIAAGFCMLTHEIFYHRYFAHKCYKTGPKAQAVMAVLGAIAPVRGPLWFAANHRDHHKYTDTDRDPHSPLRGYWHAYMGWLYDERNIGTTYSNVADINRYKSIKLIDRLFFLPMLLSFIAAYYIGSYLGAAYPHLETSGLQLLTWAGFLRVLYVYHVMALLNSLSHATIRDPKVRFGYRNFNSPDSSRNMWLVAILGVGVGWHNNHHTYGVYASTRVMWWEYDMSAACIWIMEKCGIIWDVRWPPKEFIERARAERENERQLDRDIMSNKVSHLPEKKKKVAPKEENLPKSA